MADYLKQCNSGELQTEPKVFQETWCQRCAQKGCDLAGYAKTDLMALRQATWRERFFGNNQADLSIPAFARIAQQDFPNLLQKALKLEISSRRGDWSVPDVPIMDGVAFPAGVSTTTQVEEAVRQLTQKQPVEPEPVEPEPVEPEPVEPEPVPVRKVLPPSERPVVGNVPAQEITLKGAPTTTSRQPPPQENDPWAPPPKPSITVVKKGARIQFGQGGQAKIVDE